LRKTRHASSGEIINPFTADLQKRLAAHSFVLD
jgi:hypothetical protein